MSKIGIMGGTFNPIHNGHISIANAAYKQFKLDQVWFMPNHIPAYKSSDGIVSGKDRLSMVRLAIADYPHFIESDFELRRNGKTYTYETMQLLKEAYPNYQFYFIIGADSLFYFDSWMHPEIILQYTDILVAVRDGKSVEQMLERMEYLNKMYGRSGFHLLDCEEINCSSSRIRNKLSNLLSENSLLLDFSSLQEELNPKVLEYIKEHHLYGI